MIGGFAYWQDALQIHSAPSISNLKGLAKFIQYCGHSLFEKNEKPIMINVLLFISLQ